MSEFGELIDGTKISSAIDRLATMPLRDDGQTTRQKEFQSLIQKNRMSYTELKVDNRVTTSLRGYQLQRYICIFAEIGIGDDK
jgi:hypothetical protein